MTTMPTWHGWISCTGGRHRKDNQLSNLNLSLMGVVNLSSPTHLLISPATKMESWKALLWSTGSLDRFCDTYLVRMQNTRAKSYKAGVSSYDGVSISVLLRSVTSV
jgi:hypothetical protein